MAKYAAKEIYKIRKMVTFLFCRPFDDTVACHFLHLQTSMSSCLNPLNLKIVLYQWIWKTP